MAATQKNRITVVVSACNRAIKPLILLSKSNRPLNRYAVRSFREHNLLNN